MTKHLEREIENLKKEILGLGTIVEEQLDAAVRSVMTRNVAAAAEVIQRDREIDDAEVEIEERCLQILALYQPVAIDLRFIIAVLKLNNDLERIGDLAVNIADRTRRLAEHEPIESPFDFERMAQLVQSMLGRSLDALVNLDDKAARAVCARDQEVDDLHRDVYSRVQEAIKASPEKTDVLIPWVTLSRHLERVADHATNIAEDVIYMVQGEISRHRRFG